MGQFCFASVLEFGPFFSQMCHELMLNLFWDDREWRCYIRKMKNEKYIKLELRNFLKRYSILDLITSKQNNFNFSENKISGVIELAHQVATKLLQ